jgi:hypothetical protein
MSILTKLKLKAGVPREYQAKLVHKVANAKAPLTLLPLSAKDFSKELKQYCKHFGLLVQYPKDEPMLLGQVVISHIILMFMRASSALATPPTSTVRVPPLQLLPTPIIAPAVPFQLDTRARDDHHSKEDVARELKQLQVMHNSAQVNIQHSHHAYDDSAMIIHCVV